MCAIGVDNLVNEGAGTGKVAAQQARVAAADMERHVENTRAGNERDEAQP